MPAAMSIEQAFVKYVKADGGCWLWTGATKETGYGRFGSRRTQAYAHRAVYEWLVEPIPEGLTLDHVVAWGCANRNCVNPAHLEPVTLGENVRRAVPWNRGKTHCPRGHPYSENGYVAPGQPGSRHCRICVYERVRNFKAKKRAAKAAAKEKSGV